MRQLLFKMHGAMLSNAHSVLTLLYWQSHNIQQPKKIKKDVVR